MNTQKKEIKILVVDDISTNQIILQEILSDLYKVEVANDGTEAISILLNSVVKPNLILMDVMMPGMNGFEVVSYMKANPDLCKIPVIYITASHQEVTGFKTGAVDYITKPFEPEIVRLRIATHLELSLYRENLEELVDKKAADLLATKQNFLETMASLIEYRSLESGQHVKRTRELAKLLILQLIKDGKLENKREYRDFNMLVKAVPLHDIGKIGIPDNILLKPAKLTDDEFTIMKTHSTIGGEVIKSLMLDEEDDYLINCYNICRYHHEHWDGTGYPDGLCGKNIPQSARIVAVVDVYDALISERCYKKACPHSEAIEIIKRESGSHFDPEVVDVLLKLQDSFVECILKNS